MNITIVLPLVPCPSLPAPINGMINCSLGDDGVPNPGESCSFICDTGYQLKVSDMRTCGNDGNWSGKNATCVSE